MKNKVIFLDFDGVLFDTLKEVYLVSRNIWDNTDFLAEINKEEYERYSKYKYLVYNIWMFYYYNPIIFGGADENSIVFEYNKKLKNRNIPKEEEFCRKFLDTRKVLVKNHLAFWRNLEVPYDFFHEIKNIFDASKCEIVIVSKKNKESILERFSSYDFKLDESKVFAREILASYPSKAAFMEEYMHKNNFDSAIFADDNYNNIADVDTSKIEPLLALWGNCEPNGKGYSQEEAINKIKLFLNS